MNKKKNTKVCVITNIPNPYRIPLFNTMNRLMKAENVELLVIFGAASYVRRKFRLNPEEMNFNYAILDSSIKKVGKGGEKYLFTYSGLYKELKKFRPDYIVSLGFSIATFKVLIYKWITKTPYAIWSGAIKKQGRFDSRLRIWQRRFLVKRASAYIAYGSLARSYFKMLGAKDERIHISLNTVDIEFFKQKRKEMKRSSSLKEEILHLLYIGYLVPRKNVGILLEAIRLLSEIRHDFVLDIVGDGADRENLEKFVKEKNIENYVFFHGFKQKEELPEYLAQCRCFLFQTDFDIWGLVLNEAMAAGVPCIASVNAGATHDLIVDGETGFALDFADTEKVVKRIQWILDHPEKARQIGKRAAEFVQQYANLEVSAMAFLKCVNEK